MKEEAEYSCNGCHRLLMNDKSLDVHFNHAVTGTSCSRGEYIARDAPSVVLIWRGGAMSAAGPSNGPGPSTFDSPLI